MSDVLSTSEIKKRSLTGAKWLILTNGFGMPAAYLIALILGRTGPTALGAFALAQIFIGVITTFTMFGGPAVLRNFMPKVSGAEERGRFLFSYGLIIAGLMCVVLTLFYFFPGLLEFLLRREFNRGNYGWFVLLTVVVVGSECLMGAAAGLMHIKLAAIARLMARIVILPLIAGLFLFNRSFLLQHTMETILAGFLVAYGVGAILCVIGIWRDARFQLAFGLYLPNGFWAFVSTSAIAVIVSFTAENFDRICVLGIKDLEGLGRYQAIISLTLFINVIPRMISTTLVPMFSSLLASGETAAIRKAYDLLQRSSTTAITLIALPMLAFSREILGIFGQDYSEWYYLLVLFSVTGVITSPFVGNTSLLIGLEKNFFRLFLFIGLVAVQVIGTLWLMPQYGIHAIAGSKMLSTILAQSTTIIYVLCFLKMNLRMPRTYFAGLIASLVAASLRIVIFSPGWLGSLTLLVVSLGCFWILSGITVADIRAIISLLVGSGKNVGGKA